MSVHKYYTNKAKTKFLWRYVVTVPSNDLTNSAIQSENNLPNVALAPKRKQKLRKETF